MQGNRFALPIVCVLAFCIVFVGISDAMVPFGYMLVWFVRGEDSIPLAARVLVLTPVVGTLISCFVSHKLTRGILGSLSVLALFGLWVFGMIIFVVYPLPDNQIPNTVPIITSIPFVLVVVATMTHFARTIWRRAPPQIVGPPSVSDEMPLTGDAGR